MRRDALFLLLGSFSISIPVSVAAAPARNNCVAARSEARYRNYGYDHVVILQSACQKAASCEVSTNVNPEVQLVSVAPGERLELLTFRGSPARDFAARVHCAPK